MFAIGITLLRVFQSFDQVAPQLGDPRLMRGVDVYKRQEYTEFLYTQVETAACAAAQNVEPVRGTVHRGECALNVYRRVHTPDGIAMWPNYDMPADHHLTVVRLERADGTVKGVLLHYPCHANLANGNAVHPDYPGATLRMLDEMFPGSVGVFLQGCTADLRPNSVLGERFIPQSYEGVQNFARQFTAHCEALLQSLSLIHIFPPM